MEEEGIAEVFLDDTAIADIASGSLPVHTHAHTHISLCINISVQCYLYTLLPSPQGQARL